MIKAEDFKWLDIVYHLLYLGSYLCLSRALTDCFLPLQKVPLSYFNRTQYKLHIRYQDIEQNQILTSIKGRNSVANLRKMMLYNSKVELVNDNVHTKFG